jgi:hypothetical protein
MSSSTQHWIAEELGSLHLNDQRRVERCKLLVQRMADRPGGCVPALCDSAAEAKAAYRFLSNDAVDPDAIRQALYEACTRRLAHDDEPVVLAPQDTTTLDFATHPQTEGLGPVGGGDGSAGYGLLVHSAIAVGSDGVPAGLLHQQVWARDQANIGTRHQRRQRPIEDKESFRWLQTVQAVEAVVPAHATLIHIADREGDIFELFACTRRENSFVLVRSAYDRRVQGPHRYLWQAVEAAPVAQEFTMLVHRRPHATVRKAQMTLRYCEVSVRPPLNGVHDPSLQPVTLTAVLVREINAPDNVSPIEWLLLTDLPVDGPAAARSCVRHYELRWLIERYHYVLKSGCHIEDSQLRTRERLERLLVLHCVVALRLLWMTYAVRANGDQPCTVAFCDVEWQVLYRCMEGGKAPPGEPPSLREAVRWTAMLGGFLGRKGDGEPGVKVLWRGLTRLHDIVIGYLLTLPQDVGNG